MSLSEKAAYLRGLYDGLGLDAASSKEAKLLSAVIDVLQETAAHVTENEDSIAALADQVDDVAELADAIKDSLLQADDADGAYGDDFSMDEDYPDDDEDGDFPATFEVECPNCQRVLTIGEGELSKGQIACPTCGQRFQIELSFDDEPSDEEDIPF